MLFGISISNKFLDVFPQARGTKTKINKWDGIKQKDFYTAKETINKQTKKTTYQTEESIY